MFIPFEPSEFTLKLAPLWTRQTGVRLPADLRKHSDFCQDVLTFQIGRLSRHPQHNFRKCFRPSIDYLPRKEETYPTIQGSSQLFANSRPLCLLWGSTVFHGDSFESMGTITPDTYDS